jgi:hypothetical protein
MSMRNNKVVEFLIDSMSSFNFLRTFNTQDWAEQHSVHKDLPKDTDAEYIILIRLM